MFKTKEELKFKSFAERVEFYKKYRDNRIFLSEEHDDIYDDYRCYMNENYILISSRTYNNWLFDYCFGDIK